MIIAFGESKEQRIELDILRYERTPVGEYYDDNWLTSRFRIRAGGFRGEFDASILAAELTGLLDQLRPLYDTLLGTAEFSTLEDQVRLRLIGDGKGHIELVGEVKDAPGIGNRLNFTLQFEQSQLARSIRELERVIEEFPVRDV